MRTMGNGHSRAATLTRHCAGLWKNGCPGEVPIAALTPGLGPVPPIPVALRVVSTDPTLVIARLVARAWMRYQTARHRPRPATPTFRPFTRSEQR